MDNIRNYCEYIDLYFQVAPNQEKQDNYYREQHRCLDAISNKLLLMDKDNKVYYAKMIAYYLEQKASVDFCLDDSFRGKDTSISDDATLCIVELILHIYRLFFLCEIDMNKYLKRFTIPNIIISENTENTENNIFNTLLIEMIYKKCDGKQWEHISKKEFIELLDTNGEKSSLNIKNGELNRTKALFRIMANRIEDKRIRKIWIKGIMEHVFNDVDFMKATLRTDKLSSGYSDYDIKFNQFLNNL